MTCFSVKDWEQGNLKAGIIFVGRVWTAKSGRNTVIHVSFFFSILLAHGLHTLLTLDPMTITVMTKMIRIRRKKKYIQ